jgi:predicted GNAT superfamily acetyltransferase
MSGSELAKNISVRILDSPQEMQAVEGLQRVIWPGNETEIVPGHMLLAAAHNGGLVIGAYQLDHVETGSLEVGDSVQDHHALPGDARLVGFVFGFPGLSETPDGRQIKHCSHMLGVHPEIRNQGIGFVLKRAQWQMVRHQEINQITWTYDPLLGRNAHLNITRLGAVCSTYLREVYGDMRDLLNAGLPSDRFQVDWWVNSQRVRLRVSRRPRLRLDLAHFLAAGAQIINPTQVGSGGWSRPLNPDPAQFEDLLNHSSHPILLVEIPADFQALRSADLGLAMEWRLHSRSLFERLFAAGYLVTDFIYLPGMYARSFYVLSHGESTL